MAVNFPDSPSNGDTFVSGGITYIYNSSIPAWTVVAGTAATASGTKFVLKIPADSISVGTPSTDQFITFDRGFTRNVKHRVLVANFGDGYDQRVIDSVNPKDDKFTAQFKNREASEINLLAAFLDEMAAKNIEIFVPNKDETETITVICESYSINYMYEQYHSLSANFKRTYTP